jgi:arsenate reductase-like glutaredoxin family protein
LIRVIPCILICLLYFCTAQAQEGTQVFEEFGGTLLSDITVKQTDSGKHFTAYDAGKCKEVFSINKFIPYPAAAAITARVNTTGPSSPLIAVHGNILYNFSYKSYIDTPFAQHDLTQHFIQTSLNFTVKEKYPVKAILSSRITNSPYFKDAFNVNLEFSRQQMLENIKRDMKKKAADLISVANLKKEEIAYGQMQAKVNDLKKWVEDPQRLREIAEEKRNSATAKARQILSEEQWPSQLPVNKKNLSASSAAQAAGSYIQKKADAEKSKAKDSVSTAVKKSILQDSTYLNKYNAKKAELLKLTNDLNKAKSLLSKSQKAIQDSVNKIRGEINSINSPTRLYAFMEKNGMSKDSLTKMQKVLLSINKVEIGRSWLDYSELTVKNVSLNGINVEMNPGNFYFAAAAGKLNYRFRDFILKNNTSSPGQSLYLLRAGVGKKESSNLIFTFYSGKKSLLNNVAPGSIYGTQKIVGLSAEGKFNLDANNYIIVEAAKSSYGNNFDPRQNGSQLIRKALDLKVRSNEAYSIKLFSQNPATDTKLSAYYRKTGENFQSFNLYPINVNESAWMVRANQNLWKKRINIDAAVRKNDFAGPLSSIAGYSAKTIFKSLQVSLRAPKLPFVSVGYYPSTQLSLLPNNILIENQYNTLNTIISHSYSIRKLAMNTNAVYTKFYNTGSDTGFIYFNASSYTLNHSVFISKFTFESGASVTDQRNLYLLTLEQSLSYRLRDNISLTAGAKKSRLNHTENLWGGTAAMSIRLRKFGTLQFNYDKTFLPGYNKVLMPVDMGRMSFYREF